mmetsp:Transcript_23944/g.43637  ORF Transcript_23944/g.43637 Transcript_23944/m.43637 type:complete len:200 (+) Transcript_23944:547-1146(+)
MIHSRWIALERRFDKGHAFADRHRRQVHPVGHVANGIDTVDRRLGELIHDNLAPAAHVDAQILQPHIATVRVPARRKEDNIKIARHTRRWLDPDRARTVARPLFQQGMRGLGVRSHGRVRRGAAGKAVIAACRAHFHDVGTKLEVDPLLAHGFRDQPAGLVVKAPQNLRPAVVLRHLHTQTVKDAGKFAGDIAATHDQD